MSRICLLAVALLLAACAHTTPVTVDTQPESEPLPQVEISTYQLQTGDRLAIRFYNNPELDDEQPIRPDGKISLPFVGHVKASGRSPEDLEADLVKRYTGELASPQVTVIVREYAPERYFVGGEVGAAGAYAMHGPITLAQALQEAGGIRNTAKPRRVVLIRETGGERKGYAIDVKKILSGDAGQVVYLQPQDVVWVPRATIVNVNLWVDRFIRGVLPTVPGFGFQVNNND